MDRFIPLLMVIVVVALLAGLAWHLHRVSQQQLRSLRSLTLVIRSQVIAESDQLSPAAKQIAQELLDEVGLLGLHQHKDLAVSFAVVHLPQFVALWHDAESEADIISGGHLINDGLNVLDNHPDAGLDRYKRHVMQVIQSPSLTNG